MNFNLAKGMPRDGLLIYLIIRAVRYGFRNMGDRYRQIFPSGIINTTPTIHAFCHSERPKGVKNLAVRGLDFEILRR